MAIWKNVKNGTERAAAASSIYADRLKESEFSCLRPENDESKYSNENKQQGNNDYKQESQNNSITNESLTNNDDMKSSLKSKPKVDENIPNLVTDLELYANTKDGRSVRVPYNYVDLPEVLQKKMISKIVIRNQHISLNFLTKHSDYLPDIILDFNIYESSKPIKILFECSNLKHIRSIQFLREEHYDLVEFFKGCKNLETIEVFDCNTIIGLKSMFEDCYSLSNIPSIDTSHVTDFTNLFLNCCSLVNLFNLSLRSAKILDGTFKGCSKLNLSSLDTEQVISMVETFADCHSIKKIFQFNTKSVENFTGTFKKCSSLIEVVDLDLSRAKILDSMFEGCSNLRTVSLLNIHNIESAKSMFACCVSIKEILSFQHCDNIKITEGMFYNCKELVRVELPNLDKINISESIFENCPKLESNFNLDFCNLYSLDENSSYIPIWATVYAAYRGKHFNKLKAISYKLPFYRSYGSYSVENLKYLEFGENMQIQELNATNLLYLSPCIGCVYRYSDDDYHYTHYYSSNGIRCGYKFFKNKDSSIKSKTLDDFWSSHIDYHYSGYREPDFELYDKAALDFKTKMNNNESNIFARSCRTSINKKISCFDINGNEIRFNTPKNLLKLFQDQKISKILVHGDFVMFDILLGSNEITYLPSIVIDEGVVSCRGMFSDLANLEKIESITILSKDLDDVTAMFMNCSKLKVIPDLNFDKVTLLDYMFSGCTSLKSFKISYISESQENVSCDCMFENCISLDYLNSIDLNGRVVCFHDLMLYNCLSIEYFAPLKTDNKAGLINLFGDSLVSDRIKSNFVNSMILKHQYNINSYKDYLTDKSTSWRQYDDTKDIFNLYGTNLEVNFTLDDLISNS